MVNILDCWVVTKEVDGLDHKPTTLYWDFVTWEFKAFSDRSLMQVTLNKAQTQRAVEAGGTLRRFALHGPLPD